MGFFKKKIFTLKKNSSKKQSWVVELRRERDQYFRLRTFRLAQLQYVIEESNYIKCPTLKTAKMRVFFFFLC